MATVTKEIAEKIIANNGYFGDDPRVWQVVRYTNAWGADAYAILYRQDVMLDRYRKSEYVRNPTVMWDIDKIPHSPQSEHSEPTTRKGQSVPKEGDSQ